jgi:hypothetical protein
VTTIRWHLGNLASELGDQLQRVADRLRGTRSRDHLDYYLEGFQRGREDRRRLRSV